ncbi:unnamed protein product [Rotaria socialis]|uniref:GH16 domain-containing protein n=1 Tax=Rotaria socialis TaxID=392032 RepID=A0A820JJQ6_9BILA|nr:unnamed protein product [Rotaria socialis]CAF4327576.1 unnamed protein product [Rotaria socialis]
MRWMRDPITGLKPKLAHLFCYLPFAAGPRNCIGQNFALLEAKVMLAMLIKRCTFELVPGQKVTPDVRITMGPNDGHPTDGLARTFRETFDSPPLNTTIWNYGYPWGSYSNHRANTIPRQVKVTPDGLLNITAIPERSINLGISTEFGPIDIDFTSGALNTNGKFCIKNGYVEVQLRAPDLQSTWPSVFLVAQDQNTVPMITVMEVVDARSRYNYGFKYTNDQGGVEEVSERAENRPTSNGLHRFGVDWGYDQMTWYYDDGWVKTIIKSKELRQVDNMCLVIGLGVGGKSKETPVNPRAYPSIMSIDWIDMWQPKYDGFYKIQNVQTGLLMEIDSASNAPGARILQWYDIDGDWQKWHVQYAGHGQYRIIVAHSRQALDANYWPIDGTLLIQRPYNSGNSQLWKINEAVGETPDVVQLVSVQSFNVPGSSGRLVSVPANSINAGVQLQLWQDVKTPNQKWKMIRL